MSRNVREYTIKRSRDRLAERFQRSRPIPEIVEHSLIWMCPVCEREFKTVSGRIEHVKARHPEAQVYSEDIQ